MAQRPISQKLREGSPYVEEVVPEPQDLNNYEPSIKEVALHDGTGTQPEGLYWYDDVNNQWVKVSSSDTGSSVTIGL